MPGEFDIIREYFTRPSGRNETILGVGDDAALLQIPEGHELTVTTDTLVAGRHFPDDTKPEDIGWKALAVNLSDLAAMGAEPAAFVLALTLPEHDPGWLKQFAQGLFELAQAQQLDLVGGDTTRGTLSITISAYGFVPKGQALRRNDASPGDRICVTGTLGDAALALKLGMTAPETLAIRLHRPEPRVQAGMALRGLASAAIDLSDGLAGDLRHILEASACGADVELGKLPQSSDFRKLAGEQALPYQLAGGDDYELCFCLPPERLELARAALREGFTVVGTIREGSGLRWLDETGANVPLALSGYDHFTGNAL